MKRVAEGVDPYRRGYPRFRQSRNAACILAAFFLSLPHPWRWLPKADGRSSAVTFDEVKVPHCRDKNTVDEINVIFALTMFFGVSSFA